VDLEAQLRGHTDTKITVMRYIRCSELMNPVTAALLDQEFPNDEE